MRASQNAFTVPKGTAEFYSTSSRGELFEYGYV